ncbi:MAG: hypothetical protein CR972_04525 [Candidatus Moraniibacteriota bacterium]|nr:MAG: hypothetical protein CR972_04525 [Candidatus Moranbacteria bacterium]
MSQFEKIKPQQKKDEVPTLDVDNLEKEVDKIFGDLDESVEFEDSSKKVIESESKENIFLAQNPEIRKVIEEVSDIELQTDVDEKKVTEQVQIALEDKMKAEAERREKIKNRNIRNFKETVRSIAKNKMFSKRNTEMVIASIVKELEDESNNLAKIMEDPRMIVDNIVPDAIEKIEAMEELDNNTTH